MAKYRGKHEGVTRGKYVREMLRYEAPSRRDARETGEALREYLFSKGDVMNPMIGEADGFTQYAFHVGGASVGVHVEHYSDPLSNGYVPVVDVRLSTNDSLDDVVKLITDKFPKFKPCGRMEYF